MQWAVTTGKKQTPLDRRTVLAVDDDALMLNMVKLKLEGAGFDVVTVQANNDGEKNGFNASLDEPGELASVMDYWGPIDAIISDFDMTVFTGADVLKGLRDNPKYKTLPAAVFSGSIREEVKEALEEAGLKDVEIYQKPVELNKLIADLKIKLGIKVGELPAL